MVMATFFLILSDWRMCTLPKYREYLYSANSNSCKYPRALYSVFGNGIPRSEVQIQLLPSGHKLDYSESWSRGESPVCHLLRRLKPCVLARRTTFYYPSTQIPSKLPDVSPRKAREWSDDLFGGRVRKSRGFEPCTLSPERSADMLKTLQLLLSPPQPEALDDVLAESFSPQNRREICAASFWIFAAAFYSSMCRVIPNSLFSIQPL